MFSFTASKKTVDIGKYIRRICDLTAPRVTFDNERSDNRCNRSIPVLLCPWHGNGTIVREKCLFAMTKDFSDRGMALILNHPIEDGEAVVGIWLAHDEVDEPWFFKATTHASSPIGGGFWQLGVELIEYMNDEYRFDLEQLKPLAEQLRPQLMVDSSD